MFTQPWIGDFTQSGQIGDTIGGTTAPFVGLLSAWLVYRALKAQIQANQLITDQFHMEHLEAGIVSLYGFLEKSIDGFAFKTLPLSLLLTEELKKKRYRIRGFQPMIRVS